jgi:hypothetical protein
MLHTISVHVVLANATENLMGEIHHRLGCLRRRIMKQDRLPAGKGYLESRGLRDNSLQNGCSILLTKPGFVRPMYQQATIVSRHQMSQQVQAGVQLPGVGDGLVNGS